MAVNDDGQNDGAKTLLENSRRIIEAEISWISSLILFFATVYSVIKLDLLWATFGIFALSLYILPIIMTRDPFRAVPWEMALLLSIPMLLHISEGSEVFSANIAWWDDMTSLSMAFSLSTLGFLLTIELEMFTAVRMNRPLSIFFVFMFTLAISGFWYLGEFIGDSLFETDNLTTNGAVMNGLLWTMIGGVLMGIVYGAYTKTMSKERRQALGLIHLWEVRLWRKD